MYMIPFQQSNVKYCFRYKFIHTTGTSRQGVPRVVVFLINSRCSDTSCSKDSLEEATRSMKDDGVVIFAVGVGESVAQEELKAISSQPSDIHSHEVFSFGGLRRIISSIVSKTCSGIYALTN